MRSDTEFHFLQSIPDGIDVEELKDDLSRRFPQILGIHEMHVWSLVKGNRVATMHATFISQQVNTKLIPANLLEGFGVSHNMSSYQ